MEPWCSRRYLEAGHKAGIADSILQNAIVIAQHTLSCHDPVPPILSLGHLANYTGIDWKILHDYVSRGEQSDFYREFLIRKRPIHGQAKRYRLISTPEPNLKAAQTWIACNILNKIPCHLASTAFAPGCRLIAAAAPHCSAKWIIKFDVLNFFESITEIDVYRVFHKCGYQPLVAFELSRICTKITKECYVKYKKIPKRLVSNNYDQIYYSNIMGVLPQGAPTSPMLANLAVRDLDDNLENIAKRFDLRYTRYADDLTFSTTEKKFGRSRAVHVIGEVYHALGLRGLTPNRIKTKIISPGARKIVLGLLVDGPRPRLTRDFRSNLRKHLYHVSDPNQGPVQHAISRKFGSVEGLRQHLLGLIAFADQIDPIYADKCREKMKAANWNVTMS